ncbi:CAX-interacting protein 4 [Heracleum sosnowskyi]|uniref:CAX-interacting protein 4 n=1 Tax=Heracleum sosnowskyi TaxID=360622 RepID=A0AAD8HL21_9APIA|nr:CAX-interacting protein 4 [Heracleum sosnowskyi]
MPATAGRVRMPANNRVHSSAALQTHGIWQSAIGYDPYAPNKDENKKSIQPKPSNAASEPEGENAYASFQGLMALARVTSNNVDESRGACKKCGRVGHLTFQCRNFLSIKDESNDKDPEAIQAAVMSGLEKIKGGGKVLFGKTVAGDSDEDSEDESESSDSDYDSDIERAIAQSKKFGKKIVDKVKSSRKKNDDTDEDESDYGRRKDRSRSKKRRSKKRVHSDSDEDDAGSRKRRKEKRRRDELSDEDDDRRRQRKSRKEKRRRSHKHSDVSDGSEEHTRRHKRKSRRERSVSSFDVSSSDDSDSGDRRGKKRSGKKSRKHNHSRD